MSKILYINFIFLLLTRLLNLTSRRLTQRKAGVYVFDVTGHKTHDDRPKVKVVSGRHSA